MFIIEINNKNSDYHGEFIRPNKIIVYKYQCNLDKRNINNVILHEKIHYYIYTIKPLKKLFNKLNDYTIKKYKGQSVMFVYGKLPEEKFCDFICNMFHKRYL